MTASRIVLYLCLAFVGGIFINSLGFFTPHLIIGAGLILGIFLISVFWQHKKVVLIGFCLLFLMAGIWRHQIAETQISKSELQNYNDKEETVSLIGIVIKEPDIRENNIKLTIKPENIDGQVLATANRYPEYQYGDKLKISGEIKKSAAGRFLF